MRLILLGFLLALPAMAQNVAPPPDQPEGVKVPPRGHAWCYAAGYCVVADADLFDYNTQARAADFAMAFATVRLQQQAQKIKELEDKIAQGPKCGALEVLPPKRGGRS